MAYATLESLKLDLGIDTSDTSKDDVLNMYLEDASSLIDKYIGYGLTAQDYVEKFDIEDVPNWNVILLKAKPINTVHYIKLNDNTLDTSAYEVYEDHIVLRTGYIGLNVLEISYNAGYSAIPRDIAVVCRKLAGIMYQFKNNIYISAERSGTLSIQYTGTEKAGNLSELIDSFKLVLDKYKNARF